jgi:hypothetical protein
MNDAFERKLDINSPSGVGMKGGMNYDKGIEKGLEKGKKGIEKQAIGLADTIVDVSNLVNISIPSNNLASSIIYNNQRTDASMNAPMLYIDKYYQNSPQDQHNLAHILETQRMNRAVAIGAKV